MWIQKELSLKASHIGFHLITDDIIQSIPEIKSISTGILHLFIQHTSASLAINENADPDVREDLQSHFNVLAPKNAPYYRHTLEGDDDMPAHIKSTLIGSSQSIPVSNGRLKLGMWQGIYLCEHRKIPTHRNIIITLNGE